MLAKSQLDTVKSRHIHRKLTLKQPLHKIWCICRKLLRPGTQQSARMLAATATVYCQPSNGSEPS